MILILGDAAIEAARAARDGKTVEIFGQQFTVGNMRIADYDGAKCAIVELRNTGANWPEVDTLHIRITEDTGTLPLSDIVTKES